METKNVYKSTPRYIVELTDPPKIRWNQIVDQYKESWKKVEQWVNQEAKENIGKKVGPFIQNVASTIMSWANRFGVVFYHEELAAMAERSGIDVGVLVILQLIYEASTCCTSIVIPDLDGTPHHIRTMDWSLSLLTPLTIEVDFRRNGKTVYVASTWAGYVGVLTGIRPGTCSISVNFRTTQEGTFWTNLNKSLKDAWPIGFLVRETLESESKFDNIVSILANSTIIAPCYIIIAGQTDATLLTRNVNTDENRWVMSEKGPIVQANIDHFMNQNDPGSFDIMLSYERRTLARKLVEDLGYGVNPQVLWGLISVSPIFNGITIYGTYMCPTTGSVETRIPHPEYGFLPFPMASLADQETEFILVPEDQTDQSASIRLCSPKTSVCVVCNKEFNFHQNQPGHCAHTKNWHSSFGDCNYLTCAVNLGVKGIGNQHWGCCHSTDNRNLVCPKSKSHLTQV